MIRLYDILLRLYPARFREEFGDEMRATFAQTMHEAHGSQRVYRSLLELRDLPLSVLREHLAERRKKETLMLTEHPNANPFTYRACITILSAIIVLTVLCSILPFYALGIHQQPANLVIGGNFDPKDIAFYQSAFGSAIRMVGVIMFIATPIFLAGFVPIMLFNMARNWQMLTLRWQASGVVLLTTCVGLMLYLYLGAGRLILIWYMD